MHAKVESNEFIRVSGLEKTVSSPEGKLTILSDINFELNHAESVAIIGASGSGKSTLLGLLAGLDIPTHGQIVIDGMNLTKMSEEQRAKFRSDYIGFVFQEFHLLPTLTALENTALPLELKFNKQALKKAEQVLQQVGLGKRLRHYPNQLSGGEQQRVAIARAFISEPKLLLADEPTGNLDQHTGGQIIELLFQINRQRGATLVLVTHDEQLASRCQRQLRLDNGSLQP